MTGRVYCVAHAGGSATAFADLRAALRPEFEVVFADLPGHGRRLWEPLAESIQEAAADIFRSLGGAVTPDDVLLGHSLGAWVAYELTLLCESHGTVPRLLVCSGSSAPPELPAVDTIFRLSDDEFLTRVGDHGVLPSRIFDDPGLRQIYLPILRKDFQLIEEYHRPHCPVRCDILELRGCADAITGPGTAGWSAYTTGCCSALDLAGGHFFLYEHTSAVADAIRLHYRNSDQRLAGSSWRDISRLPR